ncbi:MAG: dTMP kinase [Planctomycetota bacterium]
MTSHGCFIVLEGPDGSGKTTQVRRLSDHLSARGRTVVQVREPGGTELGEQVRTLLLDKAHTGMSRRAELMLYMAARAELVEKVIRPALARGEVVLSDRFLTSSVAYQGCAGGLGRDAVLAAGRTAVGDLEPDLMIILDVPVEVGRQRQAGRQRDRMESELDPFHEKVRQAYLHEADFGRPGVHVVDGTGDPDDVFNRIKDLVDDVTG